MHGTTKWTGYMLCRHEGNDTEHVVAIKDMEYFQGQRKALSSLMIWRAMSVVWGSLWIITLSLHFPNWDWHLLSSRTSNVLDDNHLHYVMCISDSVNYEYVLYILSHSLYFSLIKWFQTYEYIHCLHWNLLQIEIYL